MAGCGSTPTPVVPRSPVHGGRTDNYPREWGVVATWQMSSDSQNDGAVGRWWTVAAMAQVGGGATMRALVAFPLARSVRGPAGV
jgi:hypothetical protein